MSWNAELREKHRRRDEEDTSELVNCLCLSENFQKSYSANNMIFGCCALFLENSSGDIIVFLNAHFSTSQSIITHTGRWKSQSSKWKRSRRTTMMLSFTEKLKLDLVCLQEEKVIRKTTQPRFHHFKLSELTIRKHKKRISKKQSAKTRFWKPILDDVMKRNCWLLKLLPRRRRHRCWRCLASHLCLLLLPRIMDVRASSQKSTLML